MAEAPAEPAEPISQHKTCVLRASIHCEGCKRKVKKILSQIHGVEFVDVDTKQQKVTVIGNVETDTLVKRLLKSGKQAQPWPEKQPEKKPEKFEKSPKMKEKAETQNKAVEIQIKDEKEKPISDSTPREQKQQVKPQLAAKDGEASNSAAAAAKSDGKNGKAKTKEVKTGGEAKMESKIKEETGGEAAAVENTGGVAEKKPEEGSSTGGDLVEKSGGGVGKKKKKKGQNRNSESQSTGAAGGPARVRPERKVEEQIPEMRTNHSPPRQQYYPAQHHDGYYTVPTPPVYGMSYNTAHPSSNYTASYYAAPPQPYSYAYAYPGSSETGPPPPPPSYGYDPRPSESFEMFSDENPNGCIVS